MAVPRTAICAFALALAIPSGASIARTADPALSPDGKTLAFTWQGDVWTVPTTGGTARRLTVHPAEDVWPRWSPDGRTIVFSSDRFGSPDLFAMAADGGGIRRLTFESSVEYATAFTPDGRHVVGYTTAWGRLDLFRVPIDGGDLVRLTGHPFEVEYYPTVSPSGTQVVYNTQGGPGNWRKPGFRGAGASALVIARFGTPLAGHRRLWPSEHNDIWPVFLSEHEVAFVSNRSGVPNVWVGALGAKPRRLTDFRDGTIRALSASADGKTLAFQRESRIWTLDRATGRTAPVEILAPSDAPRNPVQKVEVTGGVEAFVVAPDGKRAVVAARGDLFLIPEKGGTTRRLTASARRDGQPVWLDARRILYVAAVERGRRELWTVTVEGETKPFLVEESDLNAPALSPDGKTVAFHRGDREIAVVPVEGGQPRVLATGDFGAALLGQRQFNWSPDGRWLAFQRTLARSVENAVVRVDGSETIVVARVGKSSSVPHFLADGRAIFFTATEGLNFSEARNSVSPLQIVDLAPPEPNFAEDDLDALDAPKKEESGDATVRVEPRGILERRRPLTTGSVSGAWPGPDGKTIYANVDGQFSTVDTKAGTVRSVGGVTGSVAGVSLSSDGKKVYFLQSGRPSSLAISGGSVSAIPLEAKFTVEHAAEEAALFEEVWWALDRMYYDPTMHGKDWSAIKERFHPLVGAVQSRADFYALMGEMLELLDSSHVGASAPPSGGQGTREETAWLGVEWDWPALAARGEYLVSYVYARGPAAVPPSELLPGDRVVRVDGRRPGIDAPMAALLEGRAGRRVRLTVTRGMREVEVPILAARPSARADVLYEDWVAWNRANVERLGGGRVGYLHIESMNAPSLDRFLVESATMLEGKEGFVVDVRYNGGGFTSHIILNLMRKEPWRGRTRRHPPGGGGGAAPRRGAPVGLPAGGRLNGASFSNAEIFAEGFRRLRLGPIVGLPTAGGVIGTGSYGLWDGGSIRMPGSGAFAIDGENLEGNGRRPDVEVPWDPDLWGAGRDPQLERAVEEILKTLREGRPKAHRSGASPIRNRQVPES